MQRFRVEKVKDGYIAIAETSFLNKATGLTVYAGDKSGIFTNKNALAQEGTAWIFQGCFVEDSNFFDDSAAIQKSKIKKCQVSGNAFLDSCVVSNCSVKNGKVSSSTINGIGLRNTSVFHSEIESQSSILAITDCEISHTKMFLKTDNFLCASHISNCYIYGSANTIYRSVVSHLELGGRTDISESHISFDDKFKYGKDEYCQALVFHKDVEMESSMINIHDANVSDEDRLRIIRTTKGLISIYGGNNPENADVFYSTVDGRNKRFVEDFIDLIDEESEFKDWFSFENAMAFVYQEFLTISDIIGLRKKSEAAIKHALLLDLFDVVFSLDRKVLQSSFRKTFRLDIAKKRVECCDVLFLSSRLEKLLKKLALAGEDVSSLSSIAVKNRINVFWL